MPPSKAKKAKGGKAAAAEAIPPEVEEEFVAIESIFFDSFHLHEDSLGFTLHIVPELASPEDNFVSVELLFRCVSGAHSPTDSPRARAAESAAQGRHRCRLSLVQRRDGSLQARARAHTLFSFACAPALVVANDRPH